MVVNREAWNKVKGLSTEEAKSQYVAAFLAVRLALRLSLPLDRLWQIDRFMMVEAVRIDQIDLG